MGQLSQCQKSFSRPGIGLYFRISLILGGSLCSFPHTSHVGHAQRRQHVLPCISVTMALFAHLACMHRLLAEAALENCIALPFILRVGGTIRCGRFALCCIPLLTIVTSPKIKASRTSAHPGRSSLRSAVDATGTSRTTARRVPVLEAIVLALKQCIVLDCVRKRHHATRVAFLSKPLRKEAFVKNSTCTPYAHPSAIPPDSQD